MEFHANHALGLPQRLALVQAVEQGSSLRAAAAALSVAPATAHRWWHRFHQASEQERRSLALARDRSSRPRRSPRRLSAAEEAPILRARRETNLGPGRLAGLVRRARSTVWKVLHRHGLSRRRRGEVPDPIAHDLTEEFIRKLSRKKAVSAGKKQKASKV